MQHLSLLNLRRRVIHQRSNLQFFLKRVIPFTLGVSGILGITVLYADTVSVPQSVTVSGTVFIKTVNPTPPPQPNPVPNNGVPLPQILSGTDSALFKGIAYPGGTVSLLKNGLVVHEASANQDGTFEIPLKNITPGTYTFSLVAKDVNGVKSSPVTYTIIIESGIVTEITGIVMPPTITTDKVEVKSGDNVVISGMSIPNTEVTVNIFARTGIIKTAIANASGTWMYTLSSLGLDGGDYNVKAKTKYFNEPMLYSNTILFTVGTKNTPRRKGALSFLNARCDLNNDLRVNLLDFSIMAFWYKRLGFPAKVDLNSDGRVNLTDLSILAYCWTG